MPLFSLSIKIQLMINKLLVYLTKALLVLAFISFNSYQTYGEESQETKSILQQLQILQKDIKTLGLLNINSKTLVSKPLGKISKPESK